MVWDVDIKMIVRELKKELQDIRLRKCKPIPKPYPLISPLHKRKFTYKMCKEKYPIPWSYHQAQLLKMIFTGRGHSRSIAQITKAPSRKSRSR